MKKHAWMTAACLSAATLAAALVTGTAGAAEDYPSRPIRIVTTDVGNNNDLLARLLAESMTSSMGQQVIVENRGGAGGGIAVERLINSAPDGHTIMVHGTSIWLLPLLRKDTPWDPFKDFAPISIIARNPAVLLIPSSLPPKSVSELIDYAKARPGQLNYVSVDDGSPSHLAAELFTSMAGIKVVRIAYKGGAAAFNGLLGGEGQMMVNAVAPALPHVKSGRLRALGVTAKSTMLPDLPLVGTTVKGYEWITHQVALAPLKTPPAILKRLNAEVAGALNRPEMKERGMKLGTELGGGPAAEVTAMMKTEMTRMRGVIKGPSSVQQ
jgi:tripartite-type tricarboxylate transporter receptor subunit TctC